MVGDSLPNMVCRSSKNGDIVYRCPLFFRTDQAYETHGRTRRTSLRLIFAYQKMSGKKNRIPTREKKRNALCLSDFFKRIGQIDRKAAARRIESDELIARIYNKSVGHPAAAAVKLNLSPGKSL